MVEVGRDLWRSSGLTPLLKQDHLEVVAQDHVQKAFEYLQGDLNSYSQRYGNTRKHSTLEERKEKKNASILAITHSTLCTMIGTLTLTKATVKLMLFGCYLH